jgi:hypothetical protein
MVLLASLWMPILLSAVVVFVASSIIHMVLPYHRSDLQQLPSEDEIMEALRRFNIPPGDYGVPCAKSMAERGKPEFLEKMKSGPVAFMTVLPSGVPSMSGSLILWFIYSIVVGIVAGYIAGHALRVGRSPAGRPADLPICTLTAPTCRPRIVIAGH